MWETTVSIFKTSDNISKLLSFDCSSTGIRKKKKNWYKKNFFMNFKTLPFNQKFLKARISSFYWYMSLHLSISQLALLYYYTVNIDWNNGKIRQPYFWFYNPNNNRQKKTKWWYNNVSLIIKITGTKYS